MPGSLGSPNSELAIAYVQCGQSLRPAMTCPFRHSGAETIFLVSVMPSDVRPLARFTQPAVSLYGQVIAGLSDWPHWTYAIASSLFGDPTDPGMPPYMTVAKTYSTPANAPDPWNIVNFGQMLTTIKIMN